MNKKLEDQIMKVISEATFRPLTSFDRTTHLEIDLGLDSIALASLTAKFEKTIAHHPEVHQLTQALLASATVGDFIDLICENAKDE